MNSFTALRVFPQARERVCGCVYLTDTYEEVYVCDEHHPLRQKVDELTADLRKVKWEAGVEEWVRKEESERAEQA